MRGYLSILDKLPNRLTVSVNNVVGVFPCEIKASCNAGGIPLVGVSRFLFTPRLSFPVCDGGFFVELFCKWFSKSGGNCSNYDKFPNVLTLFDSLVCFSLLYSAISTW